MAAAVVHRSRSTPHAAGLAAVTEAGVEVVASLGSEAAARAVALVAEADVVLDGILGIGGRPGLPAGGGGRRAGRAGRRRWSSPSTCRAAPTPQGEISAPSMRVRRRDGDVRRRQAGAPAARRPSRPWGVLTVVDIGRRPSPGRPLVQRLTHDDAAALWPVPGPADDKYSRGVARRRRRRRGLHRAPPLLSVTAARRRRRRDGALRRTADADAARPQHASRRPCTASGGCRRGWSGRGSTPPTDTEHGRAQRRAALDALASGEPCVVDAGGLDLLERGPRPAPTLLTPHAGELARLLTRLDAAGRARRRHRRPGPARPPARRADRRHRPAQGRDHARRRPGSGRAPVRSQADAPPWLATAGSGDVLAGLAGTLLAAGLSPLDAGSVAALVHGLAGDAANPGGPVRALGVAHAIPVVVAARSWRAGRADPERLGPMSDKPAGPDADPCPSPGAWGARTRRRRPGRDPRQRRRAAPGTPGRPR